MHLRFVGSLAGAPDSAERRCPRLSGYCTLSSLTAEVLPPWCPTAGLDMPWWEVGLTSAGDMTAPVQIVGIHTSRHPLAEEEGESSC